MEKKFTFGYPALLQSNFIVPHGTRGCAKYCRISNLPCPKEEVLEGIHGCEHHFPKTGNRGWSIWLLIEFSTRVSSRLGETKMNIPSSRPKRCSPRYRFRFRWAYFGVKGRVKQRAATYHSPQLLMAAENSPPTVTPKVLEDWFVAVAQSL